MNDDLISRQAAVGAVKKHYRVDNDLLEVIVYELENLPSAQPEIVRCKDCKHYYFADSRIPQEQRYTCELDGDRWKPDDYCSFAERRPDERTD